MRKLAACFYFALALVVHAGVSIEIDLTAQKAWVLLDGARMYETPVSSGRAGHETRTGEFTVVEKDPDHRSTMYGRVVGKDGQTLVGDADDDTPVPAGAKFEAAPMKWFLRFDGATGMHVGRLPGYPASHGCVRIGPRFARLIYDVVEVGTPVHVTGRAPVRAVPKTAAATPAPMATPAPTRWLPWKRKTAP